MPSVLNTLKRELLVAANPLKANEHLIDDTELSNVPLWLCAQQDGTLPANAIAQTYSRHLGSTNGTALTTQVATYTPIPLLKGTVITSITYLSATTAATTPLNQLFGIYDKGGALLASSADATTAAWAANTAKTLNLSSTYTVPRTDVYYLGILVVATAVPTLASLAAPSGAATAFATTLVGDYRTFGGVSTATNLTAFENPAAMSTAAALVPYAYVS